VTVAAERPFRFACRVTGGRGWTASEWVALALRAESLGYATFGAADHVATYYAPTPLLQLVAAHTSRIRLATLVLDNDFRHPVMLAKEAATLDVLSGGRLELGLGAGWLIDDYRRTGIPFDSGATRLAKLQEAVQLLKLLFGDAPTSFEGRFYSVHDLEGRPKPVQKPHPPLLLGGTRQRLLRFAAGVADIVSFDSGPISTPKSWRAEVLQRQVDAVRAVAGDRCPELHLNPDVWGVGRPRRTIVYEAAARLGVDRDDLDQSAYVLAGTTTEVIDTLERLRQTVGVSYVTIPSDHMEEFAPVVDQLANR
jgi:probable F420-dependent oxidoreductase